MRKLVLSLAFLSLTSLGFAQEKGIKFELDQTWDQIKTKARAENKYIFMDVFATWCGPCKAMEKDVYPDEKIGSFMHDKFISVKVQTDSTKEDNDEVKAWYAQAQQIMKEYKIKGFPSFLFFSPEGRLVSRDWGYKDIKAFTDMAEDALNPDRQFYTQLEEYKSGKMDYSAMPEFAKRSKSLGLKDETKMIADHYINDYLFKLKDQDLFTKTNLTFMSEYLGSTEGKAFKLFLKDSVRVNTILGKDRAQYALRDAISKTYFQGIEPVKKPNFDWTGLKKTMTSKFGTIGLEELYSKQMIYSLVANDWSNYGKYYVLYFERAFKRPEYDVNNLTWTLFENVSDSRILSFACDVVMKYAMEEWYQNDATAFDTYANLLYKTGRKKQAIEWEERAVKLSKNDEVLVKTLEKMKNNEIIWPETAAKP